jgi:hypothetical protein
VKNLEGRIRELSPDLHQEAMDFIEFLLKKEDIDQPVGLAFPGQWRLRTYGRRTTSLELEKTALERLGD